MKLNLPLLILSLATAPFASAAVDIGLSAEIRLGKLLPPPPPEVIVIKESHPKGPPPWAPAHGARRHHSYYYYPGAHVYFRPDDRMWFYLDGREWRSGVSLPANVRVDFDRSVSLSMESDRPHQFHDKVQTYYPADYFVSSVRVKDKDGKPGNDKFDHADGPSPGNSGGKGKGKGKGKSG